MHDLNHDPPTTGFQLDELNRDPLPTGFQLDEFIHNPLPSGFRLKQPSTNQQAQPLVPQKSPKGWGRPELLFFWACPGKK